MFSYAIKLLHGNFKTVEGEKINQYFAMREDEGGWKVTHLPTGRLLTDAAFVDRSIAKSVAVGLTGVYGDILSSEDKAVLKNNQKTEIQRRAYHILLALNEWDGLVNNKVMTMIAKEARVMAKISH